MILPILIVAPLLLRHAPPLVRILPFLSVHFMLLPAVCKNLVYLLSLHLSLHATHPKHLLLDYEYNIQVAIFILYAARTWFTKKRRAYLV